jgi:hypothetical protein
MRKQVDLVPERRWQTSLTIMSVGRISLTAAAEVVAAAAAEEDVVGSGEAGEAGKQAAADQASTSSNFPFFFNPFPYFFSCSFVHCFHQILMATLSQINFTI